jgi:hypothetical protein
MNAATAIIAVRPKLAHILHSLDGPGWMKLAARPKD